MQQHDVNDTMITNTGQGKASPPNTPGAREAEDDIQQQTQVAADTGNKILKGWEKTCIVAT